jgi:hypothetical protein
MRDVRLKICVGVQLIDARHGQLANAASGEKRGDQKASACLCGRRACRNQLSESLTVEPNDEFAVNSCQQNFLSVIVV